MRVAYFDMMNPLHFDRCLAERGGRVVLLGANETAESFLKAEERKYEIVGVVDRDAEKWGGSLAGREVQSPRRLLEGDAVVLVMEPDYMSVAQQLNWMGVEPYFHWDTLRIVGENGSDNRDVTPEEAEELSKNPAYDLPYEGWDGRTQYTHAMGTVDGIRFTNSREAFEESYEKGIRVFECDIARDSSGVFYLCHGGASMWTIFKTGGSGFEPLMSNIFNETEGRFPVSFKQLAEEKIYGRYTPLRLEDLIALMQEYPDIAVIVDAKTDMRSIFEAIGNLDKDAFRRMMLTCPIPKLEEFAETAGRESIGAILLREGDMDGDLPDRRSTHNDLIRTCLRNGIKILQVPVARVNKGFGDLAKQFGVRLCVPLLEVSVEDKQKQCAAMGVSIFEMRGT
jgi:hypothetical protein